MRRRRRAAHAGVMETEIHTLSTGGSFLEALRRRDFAVMGDCLAADVRFRALLPPRDVDVVGPDATLAEFRPWFGDESDSLRLVDATVRAIGQRLYLPRPILLAPARRN